MDIFLIITITIFIVFVRKKYNTNKNNEMIKRARKRVRKKNVTAKKKNASYHHEKLMQRLTNYEIKKQPHLSKREARKLAKERWQNDMR